MKDNTSSQEQSGSRIRRPRKETSIPLDTIHWLKKHCSKSAKDKYLLTRKEEKQKKDIEHIFEKFDFDGSGSIEMDELFAMFYAHNIVISKRELKQLFSLGDSDGSGTLSLEEFKKLTGNPTANKLFRRLI